MNCRDCPRYDQDAHTCKDGKINPASWGQAVDAAHYFGVRAVCVFCEHRERLVACQVAPSARNRPRPRP